ncbi:MAG: HEAT repeat domain-containing protein, partial [Myxococcota bacterium]|nr:HEAT repeat domain-containing protein [Myxococcota bacterium]
MLVVAPTHVLAGDRVDDLAKVLTTSSNDKTRLAAVVALSKLEDKRAMKPLVAALSDPNPQIRAVAATGLGKLGHKAALPQLKNCANDDLDQTVRSQARSAAISIAKANALPEPWAAEAAATAEAPVAKKKRSKAGFGSEPRAIEPAGADTYVAINSSMDDSPGKADKKTRRANADILRNFLMGQFRANPMLSTVAEDAQKKSLTARHLDLSVVKLDVVTAGTHIEVEAQLRLAISDANGKMLSFVSGGAKV